MLRASCFVLFSLGVVAPVIAQPAGRVSSLPPAEVEQLDAASAAHLENAKRFLAERQWSEAVESIRRVQETEPARLVKIDLVQPVIGFERYVTAGEYAQWRLAALQSEAPEALAQYRRLVDSLVGSWLREAEQSNDAALLQRIVDQAFASSFGDDALLKLGDLALARGDYAAARGAWNRIYRPSEMAMQKQGNYPASDIPPATLLARHTIASIFAGSRQQAESELGRMQTLYPHAEGTLAGRSGRFSELLQSLFDESAAWPPARQSLDWPTFAGNSKRAKIAQPPSVSEQPLWTYRLPRLSGEREVINAGRLRAADDRSRLLSYFPAVADQKVFLRYDANGSSYVVALDLQSGQQLWQIHYSRGIGRPPAAEAATPDQPLAVNDAQADLPRHIGVARYTTTIAGDKLFARLGSPITVPTARRAALWLAKDQGFLLGLDLTAQGKPLEGFPMTPPSSEWTFEGTPLNGGSVIHTALRRVEGSRSQLYLAAIALQTTPFALGDKQKEDARSTGRFVWRTRICSSSSLGGGEVDQLTHLLVTRQGGQLYLNTSAGAVAAVRAADGRLNWLVKYPRVGPSGGDPDRPGQHLFRDLVPCLAWKDLVFVAPADSDRIFALEAESGELAWTLPPGTADDATHLLGAADDTLLVSGDSLYWIDALTGRLQAQFPPGRLGGAELSAPAPRGLGRGIIAGSHVWWPTRESIFVFETRPVTTSFGWQPKLVREIPLLPRGVTGGNLVIAEDILLIASGDQLSAFGK